jgi:hypothetical protein
VSVTNAETLRARHCHGLSLALRRTERLTREGGDDALIPFTEAVMWLYNLQLSHARRLGNGNEKAGSAPLYDIASLTDEGKTFLAVVWARGLTTHRDGDAGQLVIDFSTSSILGVGITGAMVLDSGGSVRYKWAEVDDLPNRRPGQHEESLYGDLVAGAPLTEPLRSAESFVLSLGS